MNGRHAMSKEIFLEQNMGFKKNLKEQNVYIRRVQLVCNPVVSCTNLFTFLSLTCATDIFLN